MPWLYRFISITQWGDHIHLHSLCKGTMLTCIQFNHDKTMRWQSFSSQMCKVHVWLESTKGIQMSIITSITVSKATTNLTKHDRKLIKTLNKWKIMIWTIWYNKTEHICTILNWIDNQESGNYKYPRGVETNDIARKWVAENLERYGDQWASSKVCQGMPVWDLVCQESKQGGTFTM